MITRKQLDDLIAYLERAAQDGSGADLRPVLAAQLLEALEATKLLKRPKSFGDGEDTDKSGRDKS